MNWMCLTVALVLTALLGFVSYVQLLYLESLRIIKRESPALIYFRESLSDRIGQENERGSLIFSLLKHISLPLVGLFYFCTLSRPGVARWQVEVEAIAFSLLAMLLSTYLIPMFLYRRTEGKWMVPALPLIRLLAVCTTPLAVLVQGFQAFLADHRENGKDAVDADSVQNVEALITAGAEEGIIEEEDRKLIHSVVAFGDKSVREVMTPRPSIVAIAADKSIEDLRQLVIHEQYSRVPVYQDNIDCIVGFIHVRDIFELEEEARQTKSLSDLIRPVQLVPESKPVTDLLRDMQRDGSHMAVVVDEYGNTAGVVTMEDLVEEILGEIRDEHEPGRDVKQESDAVFIAPGSLDLDRLEDLLQFRPEQHIESTTLGGLVTELLGHVPQTGEAVERGGVRFEVIAANERRVEEVRISRVRTPSEVVAGS